MENERNIIHEPVTQEILRDRDYSERPENIRIKAPDRKHVFWLPRRDDAQTLVVRIQARITVIGECNFWTDCGMGGNLFFGDLEAIPEGYYKVHKPYELTTQRLQCGRDAKTYKLILRDSLLAYSSTVPIVIHAHEDIDINYTVEARPAESVS
jgi:serine protease inhibitor ecotin